MISFLFREAIKHLKLCNVCRAFYICINRVILSVKSHSLIRTSRQIMNDTVIIAEVEVYQLGCVGVAEEASKREVPDLFDAKNKSNVRRHIYIYILLSLSLSPVCMYKINDGRSFNKARADWIH